MNNFFKAFLGVTSILAITSCAAGSATAGYAIRAQTASGLTAEAETAVVNRAKTEMYKEMNLTPPSANLISTSQ